MDQVHSHSQDNLWGAVEIIPNRLYYSPLKFLPSNNEHTTSQSAAGKQVHYFSIDSTLIYWNFFLDFGPLNLGQLHRFCSMLNHKLVAPELKDCIICYYSGPEGQKKANASFLICAWSMLYLGRNKDEAYFGFRDPSEEEEEAGGRGRGGEEEEDLPPAFIPDSG